MFIILPALNDVAWLLAAYSMKISVAAVPTFLLKVTAVPGAGEDDVIVMFESMVTKVDATEVIVLEVNPVRTTKSPATIPAVEST